MKRYFIVFEKETGNPIGKTEKESVALEYLMHKDENGNRPYDYQSFDGDE